MVDLLKTEWLKEKRSANRKMLFIVPMIFICFSLLMSRMMTPTPDGKSFLIATAYNWYPLIILPVIISLLACNTMTKEKSFNRNFFRSLGISPAKQWLSKVVIVCIDLLAILGISFALLLVLEASVHHDNYDYFKVALATLCLFLGNLPLIPISMLLLPVVKRIGVVLINFGLGAFAAIMALKSYWYLYPWCYGIRMMSSVLGIHPNGTFLEPGSYLLNPQATLIGCILGVVDFLLICGVAILIKKRGQQHA